MAQLRDVVVDSVHPASLARFWAAALDDHRVAPYDEAELARLRSLGIGSPEGDPTVLVERTDGGGPRLWFQAVPEPRRGKNRLHLDLVAADPVAELDRLTALGAGVLAELPEWTVLADPEGNEFCLMR
ncbi:hypothetical protein LX16_1050 [Stackebrandtia albiflava]|uniref:Glyoxalase-like domain-containing protein n=1 Tax=Stackebrandtia albiflava TaxID=406432 RepID=A0A562VBU7_9ACTN|nr:VOC family protein [Stackebrandtia albiflava]TWJ15349.1 hypothetical protein LX16_1050 [Stackebrandtia albiflava]